MDIHCRKSTNPGPYTKQKEIACGRTLCYLRPMLNFFLFIPCVCVYEAQRLGDSARATLHPDCRLFSLNTIL